MLALAWTFEPSASPLLLPIAAGLALFAEVVVLALNAQGRSPARDLPRTAGALLAGPVAAAIAAGLFVLAREQATRKVALTWLKLSLHGSAVLAGALLTLAWPAGGAILVLGAVAGAWSLRSYRRAPLSLSQKASTLGLRLAAIALAVLWALHPVAYTAEVHTTGQAVLIGVDVSGSMTRFPARPGASQTRLDAAITALQNAKPQLAELAETAEVLGFGFSTTAYDLFDASAGTDWARLHIVRSRRDPRTAIGQSVYDALRTALADRPNVAAVVILTDGCNTSAETLPPPQLIERLAALDVPLYPVAVGAESASAQSAVLSLANLDAPDEARSWVRQVATAELRAAGLADKTVRITARLGEQPLPDQLIEIERNDQTIPLKIPFLPRASGMTTLVVTVEPTDPAAGKLTGRRELRRLIHVRDTETRVLYLEGRYRYESKFLVSAIGSAEGFVIRRVILGQAAAGQQTLGETLDEWLGWDVIILGDVRPDQLTAKQIEIIRTLLTEHDKGLTLLGGMHSFGAGGWQRTPLADLAPVSLAASHGQIDQPVQIIPTAEGLAAPLMDISGPDETPAEAWTLLGPLPGASRLARPKPAATVLARSQRDEPMIVTQRVGTGRVVAVAFDTTWRWVLSPRGDLTAPLQQRFWRNVALYLARPRRSLWIRTDRASYDLNTPSQRIAVTTGLLGAPDDTPITVHLVGPGDTSQRVALDQAGHASLEPPAQPGLYELRASAAVAGQTLTARQPFEVVRTDPEAEGVLANTALLRSLARQSGGQFTRIDDLPYLLTELQSRSQPIRRTIATTRGLLEPWRWLIVLAIIALLCGEWLNRKRRDLA